MKAAAIRALLLVMLALGGVSSSAATAGAQVDPIGTVTSAISTIASQTTVVSDLTTDLTGDATGGGSGLTDAVYGTIDAVSESGVLSGSGTTDGTSSGSGGGSGSASRSDASSGSATSSNRGSPRTRFDRLPRRYETLLERIESGRHVRANIARLRALLAGASPELRARVLRLIRLEIRRLERGGLTGRERAAAQRLSRLLTTLQGQASRTAMQRPVSLVPVERSGIGMATASGRGVLGATARFGFPFGERPPTNGRDGARIARPTLPLPLPSPSGLSYWLLLMAAIAGLVVLFVGASRHVALPLPGRGVVEVPREMRVGAAVILLSLVVGVATALFL
jgi:hypothetical protein